MRIQVLRAALGDLASIMEDALSLDDESLRVEIALINEDIKEISADLDDEIVEASK